MESQRTRPRCPRSPRFPRRPRFPRWLPIALGLLIPACLATLLLTRQHALPDAHFAASSGDVNRLRQLIERDPSQVHARARYGWTPLMYAVQAGHVEAVRLLIDHGADTTATEQFGLTPARLVEIQLSDFDPGGRDRYEAALHHAGHDADEVARRMRDFDARHTPAARDRWVQIKPLVTPEADPDTGDANG